jgi:hypothetical protein
MDLEQFKREIETKIKEALGFGEKLTMDEEEIARSGE